MTEHPNVGAEVLAVERPDEAETAFRLTVRRADRVETIVAGAVLDALGT